MKVTIIKVKSLSDQIFSFKNAHGNEYEWNVSEGRRIAEKRSEILTFTPSDFEITREHIKGRYAELNEEYAMSLTNKDLLRPLLFVPFEGLSLLVDGWHRLYKAVATGVHTLPCYQLTQAEADSIRIPPVTQKPAPKQITRPTKFPFGRVTATPGALIACAKYGLSLDTFLGRHQSGDFGDLCAEDKVSNRKAVLLGYRILSEYALPDGLKLWIITEADRSSTTALLSGEY